jgi:hypothetical protein
MKIGKMASIGFRFLAVFVVFASGVYARKELPEKIILSYTGCSESNIPKLYTAVE